MIIGKDEEVCDIPEYAHICDTPENIAYWNWRARGLEGLLNMILVPVAEKRMCGFGKDKYMGKYFSA